MWNRALPARGVVRPLNPHEFDALVMGKLGFDAAGLAVAEDDGGRIVGWAHAGFGPAEPLGPSHRLDRTMGTVAMLVVEPGRDDPELERALMSFAEEHLRRRGARVLYAGGQSPLNPFYWGLYGGSEFAGILDDHPCFHRAARAAGYEPVASTVLLEVDLTEADPRDPRAPLIRRQVRLDMVEDASPAGWWESLAIGLFRPTTFRLFDRLTGQLVARATTWDIAAGFTLGDGRSRTGLLDVEVDPARRRRGFGRHLVMEILRHARTQFADLIAVQTSATNEPALALYDSLGFRQVGSSTLYRRP